MSASSFFIAHGEKLAVLVVAGGCGFVLWNTFSDQSFQPKDNTQRVEDINRSIEDVFKNQNQLLLREPRPYLEQLLARVGEQTPVTPTMSWLTTPPDVGKGGGDNFTFLYIYELLAPSVKVKDLVGQLQVTVSLPEKGADEGDGRRVSSADKKTWTRKDKLTITNRARHLGVQVEIKVGKGDWRALVLPGASKEGVLPLQGLGTDPVVLPALEPWQKHTVRARIIASATALDFNDKSERPQETVVVFPGRVSTGPIDDDRVLQQMAAQLGGNTGPLRDLALKPVNGPLPSTVRLDAKERIFLGPWSTDDGNSSAAITGNVRTALTGFTVESQKDDPSKTREVGKFLLVRLFQQGNEQKWLEKPLERKYGVGDRLGDPDEPVPNPFTQKTIKAVFSTPFVIQSLVKDQKRVLYWTIKPKARQGGGKERDLAVDKKDVPTDIVVLKNPETGSELVLTKLIAITPPPAAGVVVYPFRAAAQNERDDFAKAPNEFKQWGLMPEEPKAYQPNSGPLEDLHKAKVKSGALDAASFTTDTVYYELADQRLVWWDTVSHSMMKEDPKGVEKAAMSVPTATPVLPTPKLPGEHGAAGGPPGQAQPETPPIAPPGPSKR